MNPKHSSPIADYLGADTAKEDEYFVVIITWAGIATLVVVGSVAGFTASGLAGAFKLLWAESARSNLQNYRQF